jgi:hypothetical protein
VWFSNPGAGIALPVVAAGAVAVLLAVTAWAAPHETGAPAARAESAVWTPRELVSESPCLSLGRPDPFPGVRIRMNVLQPAADESATAGTQLVPAHWKAVDLTPERDAVSAAGDCELVEQVKQSILPMFATRNVEYSSNCVPHQLQTGATRLRAEVLVPNQQNTKLPGSG